MRTCSSPAPSATISTITFPNATVSSQPPCRTDFMLAGACRRDRGPGHFRREEYRKRRRKEVFFLKIIHRSPNSSANCIHSCNLTYKVEYFPKALDVFHIFILQKAHRKYLEGGGPFKNTCSKGDWHQTKPSNFFRLECNRQRICPVQPVGNSVRLPTSVSRHP